MRQVAALERKEDPFKDEKKAGRHALLSEENWEVLCGWILQHPKKVGLREVKDMMKELFGVTMKKSAISDNLGRLDMSSQLTGKRKHRKLLSPEDNANACHNWVAAAHTGGFFQSDICNIGCIDFISNSRRTEREKTYNLRGGIQKKIAGAKVQYTDSYLICLWAEGYNYTPALMFTHNPAFDPKGLRWSEVVQWCRKFDINPDCIYFTKAGKKYCKECSEQVTTWAVEYEDTLGSARIMRDDGNSFKIGDHSILSEFVEREIVFPPEQHGILSTCDNNFNAIVKTRWRAERTNEDEAYDALLLLHLCDEVKQGTIAKMFQRNYQLGKRNLSYEHTYGFVTHKKDSTIKKKQKSDKYRRAWGNYCRNIE